MDTDVNPQRIREALSPDTVDVFFLRTNNYLWLFLLFVFPLLRMISWSRVLGPSSIFITLWPQV